MARGGAVANLWLLAAVMGVVGLAGGCEAEPQFECLGADGPCPLGESTSTTGATSASVGGTGGGGGSVDVSNCTDVCDTQTPSGQSGEYPCAVDKIIDNCRRCHTPENMTSTGAPFSLDTYADSQAIFFDIAIWARMQNAIATDFMPLQPPRLSESEKQTIINEWICDCAPPKTTDEVCD